MSLLPDIDLIQIKKYKSKDGKVYDTIVEAMKRNDYLNWKKNIPDDVKKFRDELDRILNIDTKKYGKVFKIVQDPNYYNDLFYNIEFKLNGLSGGIIKRVSVFLDILSNIEHSVIAFKKGKLIIHVTSNEFSLHEDLEYLKEQKSC